MILCSQLQVLLVALSASVLLTRVGSAVPPGERLSALVRTGDPEGKEDLSRVLLLKVLSGLLRAEEEEAAPPVSAEDAGIREEVARQLPLSQRERKAGCRNFYWKTFTTC
ncbi:somatostatin-1A [Amia ocellicauda]|uniref:somatostatin-1A n=1 Tax=Amia ocellicauda TaxID=2972642 RepID=UPI003464DE21